MAMLDVKNLSISFGGLKAVDDFSITIEKGQLYGLIGPNGAGKTTIFNLLTGVYKPDGGRILLDGKDITGHKAIQINQAGIARTFQNIRLFKELSVLDNVKVGLHNHHKYSTLSGILRLPSYYKVEKEMDERAMELLKVFDLDKEFDYKASNLPYGKQRKLEIARALATEPKLLLLDEPTSGLDPVIRDEVLDLFSEFTRDESRSVLISSHIVSDLEKLCDYIAFLHKGKLLLCEEKDLLREEYGLVHCSIDEFQAIPFNSVKYKKENAYGVEAMVLRNAVPSDIHISPISIEELFVFMVKEAK